MTILGVGSLDEASDEGVKVPFAGLKQKMISRLKKVMEFGRPQTRPRIDINYITVLMNLKRGSNIIEYVICKELD